MFHDQEFLCCQLILHAPTVVTHWSSKYGRTYLTKQLYMQPYPSGVHYYDIIKPFASIKIELMANAHTICYTHNVCDYGAQSQNT